MTLLPVKYAWGNILDILRHFKISFYKYENYYKIYG